MTTRPPRLGWFVLFLFIAGLHFLFGDWNPLAALVGFAVTLVMVFAPVPRWDVVQLTKWRLAALGVLTGVLVVSLVLLLGALWFNDEGWTAEDVAGAVFLFALVLVPLLLMPRWWRRATRSRRLLAEGGWRPLPAVVDTDEDLESFERHRLRLWEVRGWAVLPNGLRVRFTLGPCPIEFYEGILTTREVWVAGPLEPDVPVVIGLANGSHPTRAIFEAKPRDVRRLRATQPQPVPTRR